MPLLRTFMAEGLSVTIFRKAKDKGDADNIVVYRGMHESTCELARIRSFQKHDVGECH